MWCGGDGSSARAQVGARGSTRAAGRAAPGEDSFTDEELVSAPTATATVPTIISAAPTPTIACATIPTGCAFVLNQKVSTLRGTPHLREASRSSRARSGGPEPTHRAPNQRRGPAGGRAGAVHAAGSPRMHDIAGVGLHMNRPASDLRSARAVKCASDCAGLTEATPRGTLAPCSGSRSSSTAARSWCAAEKRSAVAVRAAARTRRCMRRSSART